MSLSVGGRRPLPDSMRDSFAALKPTERAAWSWASPASSRKPANCTPTSIFSRVGAGSGLSR
ncbi:hypothetical protein SHIRM173S_09014 [Streptomyces hirsutus]